MASKERKWDRVVSKGRGFSTIGKGWSNGISWGKRIKISRPLGNLEWVEWYRGDNLYSMDVKWFEICSETGSRGHFCYTGICVLSDRKTIWLGSASLSIFTLRGKILILYISDKLFFN